MKIKCLIVDDEPLARKLIREHIQKFEDFEIVDECENIMNAMNSILYQQVDLMFLDIKMPHMSGIDFLKTLTYAPKVIITTGYSEYAIDAFDLHVIDYLMKPITFKRFIIAVNKYFQSEKPQNNKVERKKRIADDTYIYVNENRRIIKIYLKEIEYIEAMDESIRIHANNRRIVVKSSLQSILDKLPSELFIRIHKSYIVSIPKIRAFTSTTIDLENVKLGLGRSFKNQVYCALNYRQGLE